MTRRTFAALWPALCATRPLLAAAGAPRSRLGLCTYSCHQHWKAVAAKQAGVKFTDPESFYRYARELGAEGVQTPLRSRDPAVARRIRDLVEREGGYYEGEIRLPQQESDLPAFEADIRLARAAGATVARTVFTSGRRYEVFQTIEDFNRFHAGARRSLTLVDPILQKHRLKLAIENHKDHTMEELAGLMSEFQSEWIGVLVDTGNNLALLDEPHAVIETLAPFALSVHLKDMAVQPYAKGFLLSEVPLGRGLLDLPRLISTLRRANPGIIFNLEMATRDPLEIPCLTDGFWTTLPGRKASHLAAALARVQAHPPQQPPPQMSGKPVAVQLAEEEANNRHSLDWMHQHIRS